MAASRCRAPGKTGAALPLAVGGQRHGDGDHLRALAGGAFALGPGASAPAPVPLACAATGARGFVIRAPTCAARRRWQRSVRAWAALQAAARRFGASTCGSHALQVAIHQLQRGGFGLHGGDLVFQLADAAIERAGTGGHHVASSVRTLNSPTRTAGSAWICRLCASSDAGRQPA